MWKNDLGGWTRSAVSNRPAPAGAHHHPAHGQTGHASARASPLQAPRSPLMRSSPQRGPSPDAASRTSPLTALHGAPAPTGPPSVPLVPEALRSKPPRAPTAVQGSVLDGARRALAAQRSAPLATDEDVRSGSVPQTPTRQPSPGQANTSFGGRAAGVGASRACWVTLHGVGPEDAHHALHYIAGRFGPLRSVQWPALGGACNWLHVEFYDSIAATTAVSCAVVRLAIAPSARPHKSRGSALLAAELQFGIRWCVEEALMRGPGADPNTSTASAASLDTSADASRFHATAASTGGLSGYLGPRRPGQSTAAVRADAVFVPQPAAGARSVRGLWEASATVPLPARALSALLRLVFLPLALAAYLCRACTALLSGDALPSLAASLPAPLRSVDISAASGDAVVVLRPLPAVVLYECVTAFVALVAVVAAAGYIASPLLAAMAGGPIGAVSAFFVALGDLVGLGALPALRTHTSWEYLYEAAALHTTAPATPDGPRGFDTF